jgi:hypothetical protein
MLLLKVHTIEIRPTKVHLKKIHLKRVLIQNFQEKNNIYKICKVYILYAKN